MEIAELSDSAWSPCRVCPSISEILACHRTLLGRLHGVDRFAGHRAAMPERAGNLLELGPDRHPLRGALIGFTLHR